MLSKYENVNTDSLLVLILPRFSLYNINNTTFVKVTNLGISELSKNDSLSEKLYSYYTKELNSFDEYITWEKENTNKEGEYWMTFQNEFELQFVSTKFQDSITNRQNLIKLITEPRGRNQILGDYIRKNRVLVKYEEMKKIASELIKEIQIDINPK
ncbi:MAG: hypothetical protein ACI8RY_001634 [Urechidicola sp.]